MPYGLHSATCHPAEVWIPPLPPTEASTRFSDPAGMQGWVDICYVKADMLWYEPATCQSQVQRCTAAPTRNTRWTLFGEVQGGTAHEVACYLRYGMALQAISNAIAAAADVTVSHAALVDHQYAMSDHGWRSCNDALRSASTVNFLGGCYSLPRARCFTVTWDHGMAPNTAQVCVGPCA